MQANTAQLLFSAVETVFHSKSTLVLMLQVGTLKIIKESLYNADVEI